MVWAIQFYFIMFTNMIKSRIFHKLEAEILLLLLILILIKLLHVLNMDRRKNLNGESKINIISSALIPS